jgi:hypothetical protein
MIATSRAAARVAAAGVADAAGGVEADATAKTAE